MSHQIKPKKECKNCIFIDTSKHENDERTKHIGICKIWSSTTFIWSRCQNFKTKNDLDKENPFKSENKQIKLPF